MSPVFGVLPTHKLIQRSLGDFQQRVHLMHRPITVFAAEDVCDRILRALRVLRGSFPGFATIASFGGLSSADYQRLHDQRRWCHFSSARVWREALELPAFSWAYQDPL